jgi:CrcB protein
VSVYAWLAFLAAAAVGAPLRHLVDGLVSDRIQGPFPWGTLVVNVAGSFILGLVTGLVLYQGAAAVERTVLGTGFCGALTTFSTFTYETVRLVEEGAVRAAVLNVAASVAATFAAAGLGLAVAVAL